MIAIKVNIDARSLAATLAGLFRTDAVFRQECRGVIADVTRRTELYAQNRAPVGESGNLRQQITSRIVYSGKEGRVTSRAPYSAAVDRGADPHPIWPRKAKALTLPIQGRRLGGAELFARGGKPLGGNRMYVPKSLKRGTGITGRTVAGRISHFVNQKGYFGNTVFSKGERRLDIDFDFRSHVEHPGTHPNPFFRRSAQMAAVWLTQGVNAAAARAIVRGKSAGGAG